MCVRYRLRDGTETADFPANQSDFHHAEPVYEVLAGWGEAIDDASGFAELPDPARRYTEFVEQELDVPVELIGTGAVGVRVLTR